VFELGEVAAYGRTPRSGRKTCRITSHPFVPFATLPTFILKQYEIVPSISRPANPYDNASCESFIKTLKREKFDANRYENLEELHEHVEEFIEQYYKQKRLHSALGYCSPDEFEQQTGPAIARCWKCPLGLVITV